MDNIREKIPEEGLIIPIYKPINWTSFDVVKYVRGVFKRHTQFKKIKVGHAGTLDPLATGLLIICVGKKTKEIYINTRIRRKLMSQLSNLELLPHHMILKLRLMKRFLPHI